MAKEKTQKPKQKAPAKDAKPGLLGRLSAYLKNVRIELRRVTWPTKNDVLNKTLVVIGTLIFFGVLIYIIDTAIVPLLYAFASIGG